MTTTPPYHKIDSVFKRDPETKYKTFLSGQWANPAFEVLKDIEWVGTEKVDGTNCRVHIHHGMAQGEEGPAWSVGGRTDDAQLHPDLVDHLNAIGLRALELGDERLHGLTLYGEGYGAGIQKGGGNYRPDKGFILFDVMVTATHTYLERENVAEIATALDLPLVPITFVGSLGQAVWHFENHRPMTRDSILMRNDRCEGWVLRPARELRDRLGHRIITKIKERDYPR